MWAAGSPAVEKVFKPREEPIGLRAATVVVTKREQRLSWGR